MRSESDSWWQKIKKLPISSKIIFMAIIALIIVIILGYYLNWGWTGLGFYTPPTPASSFQRSKTLWDWMQLLLIPLLLTVGGYWLNSRQEQRSQEASKQQHKTDLQVAKDREQEAELQSYLGYMSDLLLGNNTGKDAPSLRSSAQPGGEISLLARVRTLTILRNINERQKGIVLQFLYDAQLIGYTNHDTAIVNLQGANLLGADLSSANLSSANLSHTNLGGAELSGTDLSHTKLNSANLIHAKLNGANLNSATLAATPTGIAANLSGADLSNANLSNADCNGGANLSNAKLNGANLSNCVLMGAMLEKADLSGASLRNANLEQAKLDETELYGADLREAKLGKGTSFVKASYNRMTQWPAQFKPEHAIKKDKRVLPAFINFAVFPAHQANMLLNEPKEYTSWFDKDHIRVDNGQQIVVEFDLQQDDLVKTIVTLTGLISQNGSYNAGYSPITLQLNGHPAFKTDYIMPGGGFTSIPQSFDAPQEQLISGANTLTLTVNHAITFFWLYRLEVGLKSSQ